VTWHDRPSTLVLAYQAVLREAASTAALNRWLDARTLSRLWPTLWLPPALRSAWQSRFPDLEPPRRRRGGGPHPPSSGPGRSASSRTVRFPSRDFLDVDAATTSGRSSRERACLLVEQADAGFDRHVLAEVFAMLERYPDRRLAAYGARPEHIQALRARLADWRAALLRP